MKYNSLICGHPRFWQTEYVEQIKNISNALEVKNIERKAGIQ